MHRHKVVFAHGPKYPGIEKLDFVNRVMSKTPSSFLLASMLGDKVKNIVQALSWTIYCFYFTMKDKRMVPRTPSGPFYSCIVLVTDTRESQ